MQYRLLCLSIILFFSSFQLYSQDTIRLNDVFIEKAFKKPKVKKIKVGRHAEANYVLNELFFTDDPVFYLADSLPEGYLQQINLFFLSTSIKYDFEKYKASKTSETEFEMTFYDVGDNYSIGNKLNSVPIKITLDGGRNNTVALRKIELDVSGYNIKTGRFYLCLKKITETTCEDCYFYIPALYKTKDGYHYITEKIKQVYTKSDPGCNNCFGLQMEIKTLTQDY